MRLFEGGILLSAIGYLQIHAYASTAQIPLEDVAITIFGNDGSLLAMRLTDTSGKTEPLALEVPDIEAGQTPDTGQIPFLTVNLVAWLENYELVEITGIQLFPNTTTTQDLELIPLPEMPEDWSQTEIYNTPSQNL